MEKDDAWCMEKYGVPRKVLLVTGEVAAETDEENAFVVAERERLSKTGTIGVVGLKGAKGPSGGLPKAWPKGQRRRNRFGLKL